MGHFAAETSGVPWVPFVHGFTAETWQVTFYERLERSLLVRSPWVACTSPAQARELGRMRRGRHAPLSHSQRSAGPARGRQIAAARAHSRGTRIFPPRFCIRSRRALQPRERPLHSAGGLCAFIEDDPGAADSASAVGRRTRRKLLTDARQEAGDRVSSLLRRFSAKTRCLDEGHGLHCAPVIDRGHAQLSIGSDAARSPGDRDHGWRSTRDRFPRGNRPAGGSRFTRGARRKR